MRRLGVFCALLSLTSACATRPLPELIEANVHEGDDYLTMRDRIGTPHSFSSVGPYSSVAEYRSSDHTCSILMVGGRVAEKSCKEGGESRWLKALGAVLKGAGDGLQSRDTVAINCTDYGSYLQCSNGTEMKTCWRYGDTIRC